VHNEGDNLISAQNVLAPRVTAALGVCDGGGDGDGVAERAARHRLGREGDGGMVTVCGAGCV
jgi:hypothetical protein